MEISMMIAGNHPIVGAAADAAVAPSNDLQGFLLNF